MPAIAATCWKNGDPGERMGDILCVFRRVRCCTFDEADVHSSRRGDLWYWLLSNFILSFLSMLTGCFGISICLGFVIPYLP